MHATKEAELVTAVLLYAVRCLAEGDQHALRGMNFGAKEIDVLSELNLADLSRAARLQAHCLEIRLDRQVFWPLMAHLRREREAEGLQKTLIEVDAPFELMQRLFGLSSREYTRLRRLFAAPSALGRPPEPDEATSHAVWAAWKQRVQDEGSRDLGAEDYLALHAQTGAGLRAVWQLTQRWSQDDELSENVKATRPPDTNVTDGQ